MKKVLLISPHLDDAILSAGQFIAGRGGYADVLTVFSGIPLVNAEYVTDYDKECGFNTSRDAMVVRRKEDTEALSILNARPIYTDRLDSQYKGANKVGIALTDILRKYATKEYEMVLAPLGLLHPDHIAVSDAVLKLGLQNLYLWEDLPARVTHPEAVVERLKKIPKAESTFIGNGPIADKVRALWCYKSQMGRGDLNPYNLYVPERFWKV